MFTNHSNCIPARLILTVNFHRPPSNEQIQTKTIDIRVYRKEWETANFGTVKFSFAEKSENCIFYPFLYTLISML